MYRNYGICDGCGLMFIGVRFHISLSFVSSRRVTEFDSYDNKPCNCSSVYLREIWVPSGYLVVFQEKDFRDE